LDGETQLGTVRADTISLACAQGVDATLASFLSCGGDVMARAIGVPTCGSHRKDRQDEKRGKTHPLNHVSTTCNNGGEHGTSLVERARLLHLLWIGRFLPRRRCSNNSNHRWFTTVNHATGTLDWDVVVKIVAHCFFGKRFVFFSLHGFFLLYFFFKKKNIFYFILFETKQKPSQVE